MLTLREKLAHAYRRFGFGATPAELDKGEKIGLDSVLKRLIDYDEVFEGFAIDPQEFVWREKEEPDLGTWRYRIYWTLRMMATQRPLQEKLTLFWHSHFAVGDNKVEDGPMMLAYVDSLRRNAGGSFTSLLHAAAKDPAMMRYLDMTRSIRGNPNENFAREVMELFTLGIGNYSEQDVKEVARALTGWGYIHIFWELPGNTESKVRDSIKYKRPFSSFAYMPEMHDSDPKTILGKTGDWDGDAVLDMLASHPVTAERISKKLWEFFAYANPESTVLKRISTVFTKSKGNIRSVLWAIAKSPEFWSDQCVLTMTKSPADFCVAMSRQLGIGDALMAMRSPEATAYTRIPQKILDNAGYVAWRMERMGLNLMNPPDVSGWKWGKGWISPAMMTERMQMQGLMLWGDKGPDSGSKNALAYMKTIPLNNAHDVAQGMLRLFDVKLPEDRVALLTKVAENNGGPKCVDDLNVFTNCLYQTLRLLSAAPEMHAC